MGETPFIDKIAEACYDKDDALLWMLKYCSAMTRGKTPDAETLAYFRDRFEDIQVLMSATDDVPANEVRDKLPALLGLKMTPQGNQPIQDKSGRTNHNRLIKSQAMKDANAVQELIDNGLIPQRAYEKVADTRSVSIVKKNYLRHKKSLLNGEAKEYLNKMKNSLNNQQK